MWYCEYKFNGKTAHFRLTSVAQKRRVLKLRRDSGYGTELELCLVIGGGSGE